ncbi:type VII secretion protein EccB [Mycobacterium talmoniae]|uniref:Type VII secretion protein EccB n=1 Tax=Mycobacterium talmoniae TaxID=1858794 RepID=A0A1S1NB09_9MYCO|nr:type VII secretion protein EccB [Mycobacterium talmoniae]OHU95472.1 type VII secretion protein EccB [Mycobacterium talmoniae]
MTAPQPEDERRSFTSRTPVNNNPDQVAYRRGFVTRHQVTGWRFVMRRIASGVALHDTRMLVDPLRTQSRAVLMGVILLVTGLAGCFVLSLIRPNGSVGNDTVLADRSTSALYVRIGDQLHPVLNLTSARLIAGRPSNPTMVKSSALDRFPRGNLVGIPGAPERMVQNTSRDADWTVCDAVSGPATGVTVIAGPLDSDGARAADLGSGRAVLVRNNDSSWLLWDGRRSRIDLHDRAVTSALGLEANELTPRPIADGLFNAIPEAPALSAPDIPDAGNPPQFGMPVSAPVGAVVVAHAIDGASDNTRQYYAVLPDGLQPITPVLAAVLRNTNSYGLDAPPSLAADQIAQLPVSRALDTGRYPAQSITLVDAARDPVSCAHWSQPDGASTSSLMLLSGSALPVSDEVRTVDLVSAGAGGTATRVALAPGTGYFTQTVGQGPTSPPDGSLFWIGDTGVRYGIDDPAAGPGHGKTLEALGLTSPAVPVPWSVLSLFAPGPALSRADALIARDWLAPDNRPARRVATEQEAAR